MLRIVAAMLTRPCRPGEEGGGIVSGSGFMVPCGLRALVQQWPRCEAVHVRWQVSALRGV